MSDSQRPADEQPRDMATRKLSDPNATVNLNADEAAALQAQADKATRKLDNPYATTMLSAEDSAAALRAATQSAPPADASGQRGGAVADLWPATDSSEDRTAMYAPPAPGASPPSQPASQPYNAAPSAPGTSPAGQPAYQPYNATPPATQGVPAGQPNFPATPVLPSAPAASRVPLILMGLGALLMVIGLILLVI